MAINLNDVRTFNTTWFSGSNSIDNNDTEFSLQSGSFVISDTSGYFHVNSENLIDCNCILYLSGSDPKEKWNNNVALRLNNEQLIILENNQ